MSKANKRLMYMRKSGYNISHNDATKLMNRYWGKPMSYWFTPNTNIADNDSQADDRSIEDIIADYEVTGYGFMMPSSKPLFIETMPSEPIKEIKRSRLEKLWIKFRHWWAWSGGDMFAVLVIGIAVGILMMLRWAR